MKRVLLTGGSGFIGQPSLLALKRHGVEVHAISSQAPAKEELNLVWHQANLHDSKTVSDLMANVKPTHLLHLAWYVEHGKYWSSTENLKWVKSTLHLVEQFLAHGGQRLVCAGTCAEYDWTHELCAEQATPINPGTLYGACKAGLQTILNSWSQTSGASFAWGRIFFPYGPNENANRLIPSTILHLLRNEVADCKNSQLARDFIYVDDVGEIFAALVGSDYCGPVNIGSGTAVKLGNVVEMIARSLNQTNLVQQIDIAKPGTNPQEALILSADTTILDSIVDRSKMTSLEDGIRQTVAWWRSRSQLIQTDAAELAK